MLLYIGINNKVTLTWFLCRSISIHTSTSIQHYTIIIKFKERKYVIKQNFKMQGENFIRRISGRYLMQHI